jgi:hypothetical protein
VETEATMAPRTRDVARISSYTPVRPRYPDCRQTSHPLGEAVPSRLISAQAQSLRTSRCARTATSDDPIR